MPEIATTRRGKNGEYNPGAAKNNFRIGDRTKDMDLGAQRSGSIGSKAAKAEISERRRTAAAQPINFQKAVCPAGKYELFSKITKKHVDI